MADPLKNFHTLKEIMSLNNISQKHQEKIAEGEKRLIHIERLGQTHLNNLDQLQQKNEQINSDLPQQENELNKVQVRLEQLKKQEREITSSTALHAWETDTKSNKEQCEKLERQVLDLLELQEKLQKEIKIESEFIDSWKVSKQEVTKEVQDERELEIKEITILKERIENLLTLLPSNFQRAYHRSVAKNPQGPFFCWDHEGVCSSCSYQLNSIDRQKLEMGDLIDSCRGCARVYLPFKVVKNY